MFQTSNPVSVLYPKRRRILWPAPAAVVEARRADVRMTEPLPNFGDVGFVLQRVRCRRRPERVDTEAGHVDAGGAGVGPHHVAVNGISGYAFGQFSGGAVSHRLKSAPAKSSR